MLTKLESKASADEQRRLDNELKMQDQTREWERVRARAIQRFEEQYRLDWLDKQLQRADRARRIQKYAVGVRSRQKLSPGEEAWLRWVENHARALDPVIGEIIPPPMPQPKG